jgi:hypothetical protein
LFAQETDVTQGNFLIVLCAALALGLSAGPSLACGGIFIPRGPTTSGSVAIAQDGEKVLFIQDGPNVVQHVQIHYSGDAKQFALVLPTPTLPTVGVGSDRLFTALDAATQPDFALDVHDTGTCSSPKVRAGAASKASAAEAPAAGNVQVLSQAQVGPYETAILRSDDADALKKWLDANGFAVPPNVSTLIDPYVAGKYFFVALKLQQDRGVGDLQPVALRFAATKAAIPLRMTAIAAAAQTDEYVWLLADARAIPENFRHAVINEARLNWLDGGSNYRKVVNEASKEAGGQAFVTDYAGDAAGVDLSAFKAPTADLGNLKAATAPADFIAQLKAANYFPADQGGGWRGGVRYSSAMIGFIKRYLPKPTATPEDYPDQFYYAILDAKPEAQNSAFAGITVDTDKASLDIQDTVLTPATQIRDLFAKHAYLTRLYTTMAPADMKQDPSFLFNPDLPKVSQHHTAKGARLCTENADENAVPYLITLNSGLSFRMAQGEKGPGRNSLVPAMPAAARIELLKTQGSPAVITDNQPLIARALKTALTTTKTNARDVGFGCAGCSTTNSPSVGQQGTGEGFAYALVVLGFWGYRRRIRRR